MPAVALRAIPPALKATLKGDAIKTPADLAAAVKAIGKDDDKGRRKLIATAKRKGPLFVAKLPKAWTETKASRQPYADVFAGLITLAEATAGQPRTSWIQLFKTGKFWDPRYGTFAITSTDLSEILENFKTVTPEAPTRLPIDYNHGTSHPDSAEQGKAAGWIADLDLRADGEQLWARVEWTTAAADLIVEKEYQFVSPTFAFNHTHTNGEEIGTTLLAAAICNRPVLEGMEPLTLSARGALLLADAGDGGSDEAAEAMFSYDEQRRRVQAALSEAFGVVYGFGDSYGPSQGCYLVDLYDGLAIYREYDGDLYQVPFSIGPDGDVDFTGVPAEVVVSYDPLAGEQQMAKTITVKDAKGAEVQLTNEQVLALAKELNLVEAPKPGETVDLARFTELSKKVEAQDAVVLELTAKNAALELGAKQTAAKDKVEAIIRSGKAAPVEREELTEFALASPALFDKVMAKRPAFIKYDTRVGSSDDGGSLSASDEVIALSKVEQTTNPKLASADAMAEVFRKNPELYARYKNEAAVKA